MNAVAEPSTIAVANRIVRDMPADEYHLPQLGVASKSMLDLIAQYPALYRWSIDNPRVPTPDMEFGLLVDDYIFDHAKCLNTVAIEQDFGDCRFKENKARRDAWREENKGKKLVSKEDWDRCRAIGDAVHKHPIAAKLISQCQPQVSMFWTDPTTGLECKGRLDGLLNPLRIILDLKTTHDASPEGFISSVTKFRYHVQDAFYSWGYEQITGEPVKAFVFIVVEKTPPYPVVTYVLDEPAKERGRELFERDLRTLKTCVESNEWPAFGTGTQTLSLKPWHLRD